MWGYLHESKKIELQLPEKIDAGKANRLFRELGAKLHYDVYSFKADRSEPWQSEDLLSIHLKLNGVEVDAQDDFDQIDAIYLFATRPSSDQVKVLCLIEKIVKVFSAKCIYKGKAFHAEDVQKDWDAANDFLLKEWGEEPGSESLRIMIEQNYA